MSEAWQQPWQASQTKQLKNSKLGLILKLSQLTRVELTYHYGKSPYFMGKLIISMAIFNR